MHRAVPPRMFRIVAAAALLCAAGLSLAAVCNKAEEGLSAQNDAALGREADAPDNSGKTAIYDLRKGDCISNDMGDTAEEVGSASVVDCDADDATYVVRKLMYIRSDGEDYPGDDYLAKYARRCGNGAVIWPSEDVWNHGGRTVICFVKA